MKRIFILSLALATLGQPAFSQWKKKAETEEKVQAPPAVRVLSMDRQLQVDSGSFVYALPRTVFRLRVVVERDVYTAGPYAAYAEKYLGVAKVAAAGKTRYAIKACRVEAYSEVDTRQLYVVQPSDNSLHFDFLKMTKDGLMLLIDSFSQPVGSRSQGFRQAAAPMFTNAGVESMFREVKLPPDTAELDGEEEAAEEQEVAPVIITQAKTVEERAAEAAQALLNLRRRKYELLTGDIDAVFSSNEALKVAVTELKQLEKDYLALFVGRHARARATYYYDVAPTSVISSYPVFKFSEEGGIHSLDAQEGRTVTLDVQPEDRYASAKISPAPKDDSAFKLRLPDMAQVRLLDAESEIYKGRFLVYQNGKMVNVRMEQLLKTE
jgi:hypothetical protein